MAVPQPPENPDAAPALPGHGDILAAATDLFSEKGYDGVSMSAIAQRAGTSKANVFHHFRSKGALYVEVVRAACEEFAVAPEALGDGGFDQRLRALLQRDFEMLRANPGRSHLILREVLAGGPGRAQALARDAVGAHFAGVVELFEQARAADVFGRDVPPALAALVTIACNTVLFQSQHLLRDLPGVDFVDDADRYAALASRILLDGLRHADAGAGPRIGSDE